MDLQIETLLFFFFFRTFTWAEIKLLRNGSLWWSCVSGGSWELSCRQSCQDMLWKPPPWPLFFPGLRGFTLRKKGPGQVQCLPLMGLCPYLPQLVTFWSAVMGWPRMSLAPSDKPLSSGLSSIWSVLPRSLLFMTGEWCCDTICMASLHFLTLTLKIT